LRGKVICLELWATWCGPCQEQMEKLCRSTADNRQSWRDRVAIVPLAIDDTPEIVARHVQARGWDQIDQYWSGAPGATGPDAPAMRSLVGELVPECFIIGRDGRLLWRGYPTDKSQSKDIAARIDEALR
jgi:thiol-disulfide isomerase/thioredoxin